MEENDGRRYDGMGIGLYLVRRLLALLGGEVTIGSKLGEGARFTIRCLSIPRTCLTTAATPSLAWGLQ
ncbi:MAG: sensor histidine kinase [Candidatus Binatia bacterium]